MMGQYGQKHVAVSAFCNITVNLTQLRAILGNWIMVIELLRTECIVSNGDIPAESSLTTY